MSGYASAREVREVIASTLKMEGRDPADYSIAGILRDAFYSRGSGYGYGALDEQAWRDAVTRHSKTGPKPTVTYDGTTYKVRGRKTEIPDLRAMTRIAALSWLCANTYPRGYSKAPSPLAGMGGAIGLTVR